MADADADPGAPEPTARRRMKAAYADRYGGPDVVKLREVDVPTPTADQILVRVRAASVNRADLDGLKPKPGFMRLFMGIRAPRNQEIGIDVAGIVEAVGPDATRFKVGDAVMADLFAAGRFGAFAEYVCARRFSRSRGCACATGGRSSRATRCSSTAHRATSVRSRSRLRRLWARR
jgi:hypothetical protein